jgi:L-2-hydroxyglutarate oxidase LhgO
MDKFAVCIAGAGVIGLAIANQLSRSKRFRADSIVIVDAEADFGRQTSSRSSEVIHAGIYYPENSLKALLCVRGKQLLYEYCEKFAVPFHNVGKCIISNESNTDSLEQLRQRAERNGVLDLELWSKSRLRDAEPAVNATNALFSPSTGIVDSHSYMQSLLHQAQDRGVIFAPRTHIATVSRSGHDFHISTEIGDGEDNDAELEPYSLCCEIFINCAGLQAQQLASNIEGVNAASIPALYPCKGDYFSYAGNNPFQHLIYPLPEPNTQGLGIHSTTDLSGQLRFGPDTEYVNELNYDIDADKATRFAQAIGSYFPQINAAKLLPNYSGIRPKLAGPGMEVADFVIQTPVTGSGSDTNTCQSPGLVQLFGIESPGLTASLAIAEYVAARL